MIDADLLSRAGHLIARHAMHKSIVIITDMTVASLYLESLQRSCCEASLIVHPITIPAGEQHKHFATVERIYHELSLLKLDRHSMIVALGGGVVGDIAGFVASTFLRGLPYVQIPTTLLAQVDSSVGGKTGFNLPSGKNLIGTFYQPLMVIIDPSVLTSLDPREFRSGLAEVLKYGIIVDDSLFQLVDTRLGQLLDHDIPTLSAVIAACCMHKASIISQDETETGLRAILNFGHTFGHAIETLTHYGTYTHGEAVARGMAAAARLSQHWGLCNSHLVQQVTDLIGKAGLSTELPHSSSKEYLDVIQKDKKRSGGHLRLILVRKIGEAVVSDRSPTELAQALQSALGLP